MTHHHYQANVSDREYYAQYVTEQVKASVLLVVGLDKLNKSTDKHFNDIPLTSWDRVGRCILTDQLFDALKANGSPITASILVCIAKEAARQLLSQ